VVIPSLPGYAFNAKPPASGWGVERIAATWADLMAGLGYTRYGDQPKRFTTERSATSIWR
jgi:hypothetical protein